MTPLRPRRLTFISVVNLLLGAAMIAYWAKYLLDGMPLQNVPLAPEAIAAVLALATGIGLLRVRSWALMTGLVLGGFWMYGCVGGINMVLYDIIVHGGLKFQSPIGPLTDAALFVLVTCWAMFMVVSLWRERNTLLRD
jgi:hypothetical protein